MERAIRSARKKEWKSLLMPKAEYFGQFFIFFFHCHIFCCMKYNDKASFDKSGVYLLYIRMFCIRIETPDDAIVRTLFCAHFHHFSLCTGQYLICPVILYYRDGGFYSWNFERTSSIIVLFGTMWPNVKCHYVHYDGVFANAYTISHISIL